MGKIMVFFGVNLDCSLNTVQGWKCLVIYVKPDTYETTVRMEFTYLYSLSSTSRSTRRFIRSLCLIEYQAGKLLCWFLNAITTSTPVCSKSMNSVFEFYSSWVEFSVQALLQRHEDVRIFHPVLHCVSGGFIKHFHPHAVHTNKKFRVDFLLPYFFFSFRGKMP